MFIVNVTSNRWHQIINNHNKCELYLFVIVNLQIPIYEAVLSWIIIRYASNNYILYEYVYIFIYIYIYIYKYIYMLNYLLIK